MIETQIYESTNCGEMIIDLKSILEEKNITPYKLSKMTGIKLDTIYHYYHNKLYRVDLTNLARICNALQCDASELIKYIKN